MNAEFTSPAGRVIIEAAGRIELLLAADYYLSRREVALLLLQDDGDMRALVRARDFAAMDAISVIVSEAQARFAHPIAYELAMLRQRAIHRVLDGAVTQEPTAVPFRERLSRVMTAPLTGIPIVVLVLYWGVYKLIGGFGAGVVVDFLEKGLFERYVDPFVVRIAEAVIPWPILQELFVGDFGVITLGLKYALALILPLVTLFFLVFSIIEDSGYLPRLALLIDRVFKKMGLSGRAVIPMVLGFGCVTMATMVTRTLQTARERIIATMLLALAVPCSAQLGIIIALLGDKPRAMALWAGVIGLVFVLIGFLAAQLMPGERPSFYMEIPPLRLPSVRNVAAKTYMRVIWYLKEVVPLFALASVLIWLGRICGLFSAALRLLKTPVALMGLPPEAAQVFLFGFFRRDYGAVGLYELIDRGALTDTQLVVASVALTLFMPCVAQFLMNIRERGWRVALSISAFVVVFSFAVGVSLNQILVATGWMQ